MLPRLLASYRRFLGFDLSGVGRIAVVGFSAGSNSGIRELLRSPLDRARISFAAAIDGLHPMWAQRRIRRSDEEPAPLTPEERFADWPGQMEPFAAYALDAAQNQGGAMVITASQVAASSRKVAASSQALAYLWEWVASRVGLPGPTVPGPFPPRSSSPKLRAGEPYPVPFATDGARSFVGLWYPGRDRRAHALQAWIVAPDILRAFLVPLWAGAAPILIGDAREPLEPADGSSSRGAGLPTWTAPALGAAAAVSLAALGGLTHAN